MTRPQSPIQLSIIFEWKSVSLHDSFIPLDVSISQSVVYNNGGPISIANDLTTLMTNEPIIAEMVNSVKEHIYSDTKIVHNCVSCVLNTRISDLQFKKIYNFPVS